MDNNILDVIDMSELGRELQQARVRKELTQEDAAKIIGVARTTLTAIEKGDRRIKADELVKLANAYDCSVSDFVRPRPKVAMYQTQFRGPSLRSQEDTETVEPYVEKLKQLACNYFELEAITHMPFPRRYPPEYEIEGLEAEDAAETVAIEERNRLGLGDGPITKILRDILEQDVGLRIFYIPIQPSRFSAIYLFDDQIGGCIAINSNHPEERRRWSLAHDYGHFLVHRNKPTADIEDNYRRKPGSERFADDFALYFLMPTSGLIRRINDIRRTKNGITLADLCMLAYYYGVSIPAMTSRLEGMKVLPTGTGDELKRGRFKVREAQEKLGLAPIPSRDGELPTRYLFLAFEAFTRGSITEGMFARFLQVDRLEARRAAEILQQKTEQITDDTRIDENVVNPSSTQEAE